MMTFKFDERILARIKATHPGCKFLQEVTDDLLVAFVGLLIQRATPDGATYLVIAGVRFDLRIVERRAEDGEIYLLVTVPEGVLQ